ncbi:MAG: hypothetical protein ACE5I1_02680 [bacterium]
MKTIKKLKPGMKGTKKLVELYGDKLVCVRYINDCELNRRIKTIELIIDKSPIPDNKSNTPMNKIIHLNVNYDESLLQRAIKSVGGKWNLKEGVWELPYKEVLALGLEERMVRKAERVSKNKKSYKRAPPVGSFHI